MPSEKTDRIIAAAAKVFMRYGFRRVTMADLAEAANMSRPALYLEFPSKEQIFIEVVSQLSSQNLKEIREGIERVKTVDEQLKLAFEIWYVRPFEQMRASPDAADLYVSVKEFAAEALCKTAIDFEKLLEEIIRPLVRKQKKSQTVSTQHLARVMRAAAKGFMGEAKDSADLRQLLGDLRQIVLSSL